MPEFSIPPADVQMPVLERGSVDLEPRSELRRRLEKSHESQVPLVVKVGFDPTAPDLHLGHTVLIEKMAQFQRFGHDVIFLIGDYTALIGDPTGRNAMRPPLSEDEIQKNAETYTEQVFKILDPERTRIEWNSRWLASLSFADVIRLAAKYNVGRMLERRDFRQRFEENRQIAIHEFLYPLMQAYDSVALKADLELGGADQIFNLLAGRHVMDQYGLRAQCVLTTGLLVGLDGQDKMSKSKNNHVGITDPPEDMFGKVMSISDELMKDWYALLTDETPETVDTDPNRAKKDLAVFVVSRFHSTEAAHDVRAWWEAGRPPRATESSQVSSGPLFQVVVAIGGAKTNSEARRKIAQGGVSLGGCRVTDPMHVVAPGEVLIRVGKKLQVPCRVVEGGQ
ncbi:MAG TPA: tyrosine--tRNA ligase [Myxococcales bacterium LLY-WYZ-16_1]|nr:tyrosine--tRNA ligase [Myxococcales bacterium LLY-WYZ-16_1]